MKSTRRSRKTQAPRRRADSCLFAAVLVLLWLLAGCSHYGYVDQESSDKQAPVSVWTVAAPADEGLDQARLTRSLVGAMRQQGVDASWQAEPADVARTGVSVRCSISHTEVDAFGRSLFASAQVICRVGSPDDPARDDPARDEPASQDDPARQAKPAEQFEASGRYTAAIDGQVAAIAPTRSELQDAAAVDALERVADQIARFVLQSSR